MATKRLFTKAQEKRIRRLKKNRKIKNPFALERWIEKNERKKKRKRSRRKR